MAKYGSDWPSVSDMVVKNYRLIVFTSIDSKEASEGISYEWNCVVENKCKFYKTYPMPLMMYREGLMSSYFGRRGYSFDRRTQ